MRPGPARGRPTWWVVLAVSLALMALIAATAARTVSTADGQRLPSGPRAAATSTTTSTTAAAPSSRHPTVASTIVSTPAAALLPATNSKGNAGSHSLTTTTTSAAPPVETTTTTTTTVPPPSGATYPGYLQPPQNSSNAFSFGGQGPTRVSVTWSGSTYLTLTVTCAGFNQGTGGSSAMALSIPNAQGSCQATVTEPSSESDTLSYTIAIEPTGG
jgi:hypothetical protein